MSRQCRAVKNRAALTYSSLQVKALHGLTAYSTVCSDTAVYKADVNKDGGC